MGLGNAIYTTEQREAMGEAVVDRAIPPKRVVELAKAGELTYAGEPLEPFTTTANTVRDRARKLRAQRAGKISRGLDKMPARDAVEALRRRLVNVAEQEIRKEETKQRGKRDLERLRQIARALREAAALPGPDDPRPVAPGQKVPGTQTTAGGATTGGLAAGILAAAGRVETQPAQSAPTPNDVGADTSATGTSAEQAEHAETDGPGVWAREQVRAVAGVEPRPAELHTSST